VLEFLNLMSARAARSAKRAKVAVPAQAQVQVPEAQAQVQVPEAQVEMPEAQVPVLEVADTAAEVERLKDHLWALVAHDEVAAFSLVFPTKAWAQPSGGGSGGNALAALYFYFGPDSVRNMDGIADRDPVFINLAETATIRAEPEIREFLLGAATVADAHYRIRKLGELAVLRKLLRDPVPAPLGTVFWLTKSALHVEYGRHTQQGCHYEPSPQTTARFSIYAARWGACAAAPRVRLTADELAAKCALFAPTAP